MKQKKYVIIIFIIIIIIIIIICSKKINATPVADSVIKELNTLESNESWIEINLTKHTAFDWDQVLIFNYPTSNKEIDSALGVHCDVETDLTNGMIFVKGENVVHMEYFDFDYNSIGRFIIYPHENIGRAPSYCVLTKQNAFLEGHWMNENGYIYYRLYPSK